MCVRQFVRAKPSGKRDPPAPPTATSPFLPPLRPPPFDFFVLFDLRLWACVPESILCATLQPTTTPAEVLRSAHSK